jgi:exodeoxyribonuclease VII small subunit
MENKKKDIETSIAHLEELVVKMESGKGSLEENIQWFDDGIKLIEVCRMELNDSEKKIDELIKNAEGSFSVKNIE